jgi:hypothetical protein
MLGPRPKTSLDSFVRENAKHYFVAIEKPTQLAPLRIRTV